MPTVGLIAAALVALVGLALMRAPGLGHGECELQKVPDTMEQLSEFPATCGLRLLHSTDRVRVYAYTQNGGWCWNSAGVVYDARKNEFTLVDLLTDPKQTSKMLSAIKAELPEGAKLRDLVLTHCDIDHWAGQQVVYDVAENVYGGEKCADAMRAWNPKYGSRGPEKLSGKNMLTFHLVWKLVVEPLVSLLGSPLELVNRMPVKMRDGVATAMAMMSTAENLSRKLPCGDPKRPSFPS